MRFLAFMLCLRLGLAFDEGDWRESLFVLTIIGGLFGMFTVMLEQYFEFKREETQRDFDAAQACLDREAQPTTADA